MRRLAVHRRHPRKRRPVRYVRRFNWRDLPAIPVDERVKVSRAPSQTFLGWRDVCHRAAYLYVKHAGGPGGHQLHRGTVFHMVVERLTNRCIERGERQVSPEDAKRELAAVFAEFPELTVPAIERDYLRMLVFHWAVGSYFDPAKIVGVEQFLTLDVGPWQVRAKVDLIEQPVWNMLDITDYKTQRNMPSGEEWHAGGHDERGNPRFGGNFQTILYGAVAAFGRTPEGLQLGEGVDRFRLFLRFPSILWDDGLARKEAEVSRLMLADFLDDLRAQLAGLQVSIDSGKWQPTPGSHCDRCPAEAECPLPRHLREASRAARVETVDDLETLAANWRFAGRRNKALKATIKGAAERMNLEVVYTGRDTGLKFIPVDREGFKTGALPNVRTAVEGAARYGQGLDEHGQFDFAPFVKRSQYTTFDERKVPPRIIAPADDDESETT